MPKDWPLQIQWLIFGCKILRLLHTYGDKQLVSFIILYPTWSPAIDGDITMFLYIIDLWEKYALVHISLCPPNPQFAWDLQLLCLIYQKVFQYGNIPS